MNIFQNMILNIIFITFPMMIYLFYVACSHNLDKKENKLLFELALLTSLYLIIGNEHNSVMQISVILINIPLMISYLKNYYRFGLIVSILLIIYYSVMLGFNVYLVTFEFVIYFILYLLKKEGKISEAKFINGFIINKAVFLVIFLLGLNHAISFDLVGCTQLVIVIGSLYIITYAVVTLFSWCEEIINLHMTIKELEQEKQIRVSLFKITHEIKNPIAVCKGYLDMFDVNNSEHSKKYIPIIKEEIKHTLLLLQDFLEINKTNVEKDILDINLLVEEVLANLKPILTENKVEVDYYPDDNDEIFMMGDYNRLRQVLVNIVKNSVEALDEERDGHICITSEAKGDKIILVFEDNGKGISKESMAKLKEPFFTTKEQGTGLGVYLSDEIIKAHDGKMIYTSKEGEGTRVRIELPIMVN